jgi:hypothetical protein
VKESVKIDKEFRITFKTNYNWTIRTDIIILILFVCICAFSYHVLIFGAYWGQAIHLVPEFDEYSWYESSEQSEDEGSTST